MSAIEPTRTATLPQTGPHDRRRPYRLVEAHRPIPSRGVRAGLPGWALRLCGPLLLLALWQALVTVFDVDRDLMPRPADVVLAARELLASGELQKNIGASLARVFSGLAIGLVAGTLLAVLAGLKRQSGDFLDSIMQVLKAIPVFALLPLLIIWMGIDEAPKVTLIAVATTLPIYINTYSAIRNVDSDLAEAAKVLGLNQLQVVWHLLLPGSTAGFLTGLRYSLTSVWLALIFAETVNAMSGLGYLMHQAQMAFRLDIIVLVVSIYALVGVAGYAIVLGLEQVLLPWRRNFKGL
jgi:sulfonate transport system permease protein